MFNSQSFQIKLHYLSFPFSAVPLHVHCCLGFIRVNCVCTRFFAVLCHSVFSLILHSVERRTALCFPNHSCCCWCRASGNKYRNLNS